MTKIIEELRKLHGAEGEDTNDEYFEIDDILDAYKPEGYTSKVVDTIFEEGGRWSNYETKIFEVVEGDETAYFELFREVPASETQEGQDSQWSFGEVEPKEVTVIQYVAKEGR
ncbi:hypothetical protein [Psychrobacillus sp. OK032]|uniref:hypothetical protein n=1 Tax=Psychrobacillus sp. OK032 TaxID=1884358 RepID=UPI0008C2D5AE|nr:hypothetical protein [Psychrobacillus sp. OK032]SER88149.1 hypothetical protein SAMN05518872_102478 [Psychrobacillus sp. OK032]